MTEFNVAVFWLSAFLAEMSIYCYFGNNIIYTVDFNLFFWQFKTFQGHTYFEKFIFFKFDSIQHSVYCSNFIAFDRKTSMAMLKMMTATGARQMKIVAVGVVRFELSLQTLLMVNLKKKKSSINEIL